MFTKKVLFMILIIFILGTILQAQEPEGTIIFTSRPDLVDEATGESPDMDHIYALEDEGYDVVIFYNGSLSTASDSTLDTLYNANLIVLGRSTPSPGYQDPNKAIWNDITTPTLCLELWACRNSRLNWLNTADMYSFTSDTDTDSVFFANIAQPDDPIFEGIDTANPVPWIVGRHDQIATSDPGNGTLMAYSEETDNVLFVRWAPDDEFYPDAGDFAGDYRTFIGNGRDASSAPPFEYYNFSVESEIVFLREIERLFVLGGGVIASPVEDLETPTTPTNFELSQNYPNPFNPSTTIPFVLPEKSHVRLSLFNILGKEIMEIANGDYGSGRHEVVFTAENLATGIYFYRIETEQFTSVKKLVFAK